LVETHLQALDQSQRARETYRLNRELSDAEILSEKVLWLRNGGYEGVPRLSTDF